MKSLSLPPLFVGVVSLLLHSVCCTVGGAQDCPPPTAPTPTPYPLPTNTDQPPICVGVVNQSPNYQPTTFSLNSQGQWLKNGVAFTPKGVGVKGFIASMNDVGPGLSADVQVPADYYAMAAYGQNMITAAINTYHANTLRFQVSQYALSQYAASQVSTNPEHGFTTCLANAVQMARNNGLMVVLAMQSEVDGTPSGTIGHTILPVQNTFNAWLYLNSLYANDTGVVYELYNEPNEPADPLVTQDNTQVVSPSLSLQNWLRYKCGDSTQVKNGYYKTCINDYTNSGITQAKPTEDAAPFVGVQVIADALRNNGSTNVLLVDGLTVGLTLNGIMGDGNSPNFLLHDTGPNPATPSARAAISQIAYAIHPYPHGLQSPNYAAWFGGATPTATPTIAGPNNTVALGPSTLTATVSTPAITAPVLVTEWSAASSANPPYCGLMLNTLNNFKPAIDLVDMMNRTSTPLLAGAMDATGILSQSVTPGTTFPHDHLPMASDPVTSWQPTNYNNYLAYQSGTSGPLACGTGGLNAGLLISNFFGSQAPVTLHEFTCSSAVTSDDVAATGCTTSANPNANVCAP